MNLKMYEEFKSNQEIEEVCIEYGIKNYTINSDGSVDVQGSVDLNGFKTPKLPIEFGKVSGGVSFYSVGLTTLDGCPKEVGKSFNCMTNKLNTLEGCPKEVGGNFLFCWNHNITSLEGLEDTIFRGSPKTDGPQRIDALGCSNLYSLDGFPIEFKGEFYCDDTPIKPIYNRYIKGAYIGGTNQLAQAIQFFNQLQVIEEGTFGWEISYRKLLEYLKRYKEFGRPTKEEVQWLVGDMYIVK